MTTYRVQPTILATDERSLYHALTLVVAQRALLLSKVKLSSLLEPVAHSVPKRGQAGALSRLERYMVDFVICDRHTTQPLFVILVDSRPSAHCPQTEINHDLIQQICEAAGLPVLRMPQESAYRMDKLQRLIEPLLVNAYRTGAQGEHDYRGSDYAQGDRVAVAHENEKPAIPRPGTIFSRN